MISFTLLLNLLFAGVLGTLVVVAVVRAFDPRPARARAIVPLALLWAAAVLFMTLRPGTGLGVRLNLVPLIVDGPASALDAVLNVIVFVPLGLLLALTGIRLRSVFALALALTLVIETTQYLTDLGRTADINDVITNTAGACLGWAVARGLQHIAGRAGATRRVVPRY
ncbi:VanZ family protein [Herbiconiux sp.]|uniref:VanZ family protein n=1 Tax=Herbiconiux sp. TaxID=1871186 RepID=UPI0025BEEB4E|nr:VanZ family protein [Herbiconiux sp.]